jgi:hypothetical protein
LDVLAQLEDLPGHAAAVQRAATQDAFLQQGVVIEDDMLEQSIAEGLADEIATTD